MNKRLLVRTEHIESVFYLLLFGAFALGAVALMRFRFDPFYQFSMFLALSIFYFIWGMFYHYLRRDLNIKVFWEYSVIWAICALAAVLVFLR